MHTACLIQECEGRLLWRARVLREGWLLLTFHHAIVDERSIWMLMRELVYFVWPPALISEDCLGSPTVRAS